MYLKFVLLSFVVLVCSAAQINSPLWSAAKLSALRSGPTHNHGWNHKQMDMLMPAKKEYPVSAEYNLRTYKDLPVNYDAHELYGAQCKNAFSILNQGSCGSCWAFGSVEALQDRLCMQTQTDLRLSEEYLLGCDLMDSGCMGGEPGNAWEFFRYFGVPTNKCVNYTSGAKPNDPIKCPARCDDGTSLVSYFASSAYAIDAAEYAIMKEIYEHGPVSSGFTVYSDFDEYKSGIYHHVSGKSVGGHAIEIVGFGVQDGVPYWRVRNSWGPAFGLQGYFLMLRGVNECGIEDSVVAGIASVKPSPPVPPVLPRGIPRMSRSVKTQFELTLTDYHMILNGTGAEYWYEKTAGSVMYRMDTFNGAASPTVQIVDTAANYTIQIDRVLQRRRCIKSAGYEDVTVPSQGLIVSGAKFVEYRTMNGVVVAMYYLSQGPMTFEYYLAEDPDYPGLFVPIKEVVTQKSATSVMTTTTETVWYLAFVEESIFVPQC